MAHPDGLSRAVIKRFLKDIENAYRAHNDKQYDLTPWEWYQYDDKPGRRPLLQQLYADVSRDSKVKGAFNRANYNNLAESVYLMRQYLPDLLDKLPDWRYMLPEFHLLVLENERAHGSSPPDRPHSHEPLNATLHALLLDLNTQ